MLDRSVKRALEKADGTRPVIAHIGRAPPPAAARRHRQPPLLRLVPRPRARLPRLPAAPCRAWPASSPSSAPRRCPPTADFCEPERWPDLDWERLGRTHALQQARVRPARAARRPRHLRRVARPPRRRTRPWWCAGTSRRCAASSTGRPAASPSSASPTATRAVTWSVLGHDRAPEGGLRRAARGVPAGDRRRRPAARRRSRRARPSPSTSTW